jgi:hypothetical protein
VAFVQTTQAERSKAARLKKLHDQGKLDGERLTWFEAYKAARPAARRNPPAPVAAPPPAAAPVPPPDAPAPSAAYTDGPPPIVVAPSGAAGEGAPAPPAAPQAAPDLAAPDLAREAKAEELAALYGAFLIKSDVPEAVAIGYFMPASKRLMVKYLPEDFAESDTMDKLAVGFGSAWALLNRYTKRKAASSPPPPPPADAPKPKATEQPPPPAAPVVILDEPIGFESGHA